MDSFTDHIQLLAVEFPPFIIAVIFHEYAHGFIARRWGDKTAQEQGRLTLNPIPHIDPIGTLLFPIVNMVTGMNLLFGWARPVPIDPRQFKKFRPGLFWVALAGPGMNFILAVLSAALYCSIVKWMPRTFYLFDPFALMAQISVSLNFALGIFNLIPLPPLDGSKIIESFLPFDLIRKYESIARYSFFILFGLLFTGAFTILEWPIRMATGVTLVGMSYLFGIPGIFQ